MLKTQLMRIFHTKRGLINSIAKIYARSFCGLKFTASYCPMSSDSQLLLSRANPSEQLSELHQHCDESSSPPTAGRQHSIFNLSSSLNQRQCNSCKNVVKQMK